MIHYPLDNLLPVDENGYYGEFGGAFVPEVLERNIKELESAFREYVKDESFRKEFDSLLHDYVGRGTYGRWWRRDS